MFTYQRTLSRILDIYRKVSWSWCDLKGRRPHPSHKGPLGGPQILTGTVQPSSRQLVGRTGSGWFLNARSPHFSRTHSGSLSFHHYSLCCKGEVHRERRVKGCGDSWASAASEPETELHGENMHRVYFLQRQVKLIIKYGAVNQLTEKNL